MALRLLLVVSFGIVLPIMYFALRYYRKPQGQLVFGVTIGKHHFDEEEIKKVQKQYIRDVNWCGLISLAALVGCAFVPYDSICEALLTAWMFITVVAFEFPFMKANSKVRQLKAERGWNGEFKRTVVVDTEVAKLQDQFMFRGCYIVSAVLSILPVVGYVLLNKKMEWIMLLVLTSLAFSGILMVVLGILVQKVRFKGYTKNSEINQAVARTKRYHWAKGMAVVALGTAAFTVFLSVELIMDWMNTLVITIVTIIYSIFITCYLCYTVYKAYKIKVKLVDGEEAMVTDDDEYWIHGLFYYNKNDTHFMVEKRVGVGTTVNMARPAAKVCGVILALMLLGLPVLSVFLIGDELSPITLSLTDQEVLCEQFEGAYEVPLSDIESVELITDYKSASKSMGTNLKNLYRGDFVIKDYGSCKVCFDPRNKLFLVIKTGNKTYIMSDETDAGTQAVYDKLLLQLKKL